MMGAAVPPILTVVPANCVLYTPFACGVLETRIPGPSPTPNNVTISPGEMGTVASPTPEDGATNGWIVAALEIAPMENGTGVSSLTTALSASATNTLPDLSTATP